MLPGANAPILTAHTLGGFRLLVGEREVPDAVWHRKKARQLLKYLLTRAHHRVLREQVLDVFWPDSDPAAAATNLRSSVHAIRQALEPGARASDGGLIVADRDTIGLQPGVEIWVDADAFERLAVEAQRMPRHLPLLEQACALYKGDYLPEDVYEDWASERREALRRTWSDLAFKLAEAHVQRGEPQAALPVLQQLLRTDHGDERAAQELTRVLIQLGRRSEALRVLQALDKALREELGVEPSERTRSLQRELASQTTTVTARPRAVFRCAYSFPEPSEFIAREGELEQLQRIVDAGRVSSQAVFISAPAGTGKSTLAGAILRAARDSGVLCLAGAAYDERAGVPLAAFQEALTDYVLAASSNPLDADLANAASELIESVRDLRQNVGDAGSGPSDAAVERSRLFRAVLALLRKLAERGQVLLCLEDLHVADAATLHLLHYLLRQTRHVSVVFIGTFRSDEMRTGEPLAQLVAAMERERLAEQLHLQPLNQTATERLIAALVGAPVHGNLSTSVYAATEGNPLFIEQLVFALREAGRLDHPAGLSQADVVDASSLPHVIREVINERVARLSKTSREMLEIAAVLGHNFEYTDLLAVVEPSDESVLLGDLDDAIRAQVVRERPTGYAFSHSLMRDGLYWGLTRTRRMLLHGRAGVVLERLAGVSAVDISGELANHFAHAGQTAAVRSKALHYSLRAGRQAAALASHREALRHFEVATTLVADESLHVDVETRLAALEGRGQAEDGMGMWPACITTFRQVLELVNEPVARARVRRMISFELHHMGDTSNAMHEAEAGVAELGPDERPEAVVERLTLQHQLALLWFLQGRFRDVLRLGLDMVELATRVDQPRWLAWAQNVIGWAHTGSGRTDLAIQQYELVLATAEEAGDKLDLAGNWTNLGLEYYRAGRFVDAQAHLERAVALYRESSSDLRSVLGLQGLGWAHLAQGNVGQAQEYADLSTALAEEAQDRWLAECLELRGALQALRAEWELAHESLARVLQIHQQVGHRAGIVGALCQLGRIAESGGAFEHALDWYQQAVHASDGMDPAPCVVAAHRRLGQLLVRLDDPSTGAEHIKHAHTLAEEMPGSLEYAPSLLALADLTQRHGDLQHALLLAERVHTLAHTAELEVEAQTFHAELLLSAGRLGEAETHAAAAMRMAERLGAPLLLSSANRAAGAIAAAKGEHSAAAAPRQAALH